MDLSFASSQVDRLKAAQRKWSQLEVSQRAAAAKRLAALITRDARSLHGAIRSPQRSDYRETIAAEILPFADAARWLGKNAAKILRSRNVGRWQRPLWLGRVHSTVAREPLGVVLIIGTWNYPLFLTGVQMLQALVAGNAVIVKPAPGCEEITEALQRLMIEAGIPVELLQVLDPSVEAAQAFFQAGIDRVIMTGSSQSGRKVLQQLAEHLVPATMELSGCDAVFVLDGANIDRVVAALLFGLRLNGGATCVAPRRVYLPRGRYQEIVQRLSARLHEIPRTTLSEKTADRIVREIHAARASIVMPQTTVSSTPASCVEVDRWIRDGYPVLVEHLEFASPLAKADIFAPITMLFAYDDCEEALSHDRECPYRLMASIFGEERGAMQLARELEVGSVIVNDVIVPSADPRLPFGGLHESGYGVTRGPEGLLELTRPKVTSIRRGRWLLHLDAPRPRDGQILEGLLQWLHAATWARRWGGLVWIVQAFVGDGKGTEEKQGKAKNDSAN